ICPTGGESPGGLDPACRRTSHAIVNALDQAECAVEQLSADNKLNPASEQALASIFSPGSKLAVNLARENDDLRRQYGMNTFGQSCLLARRLIEQGVRLVTVNMFDTVFNQITWDCHADGASLPTTL